MNDGKTSLILRGNFFFFAGLNRTNSSLGLSKAAIYSLTSAYVISFLIGYTGNALGLVVVYRRRSFKSTMNLLIMNMCFADLLAMLIITPLSLGYIHRNGRWIGGLIGEITCRLSQYGFVVTIAASILTILFISCGRFFAICYPLKGKLLQRPRVVTAWIWALAFVLMSPYVVLYHLKPESDGWICTMYSGNENTPKFMKVHFMLIFVILYAFPVVLVAWLNSIIVFTLARGHIPGEANGTSREVAMRLRYKAVKMLISLLALFAICWLPTHVMHFFIIMRRDILFRLPKWFPYFAFWMGHLNSALNPIIYVLLSDNFRRDFKKLFLRSKRVKNSVKATNSFMMSSRERSGSGLGRLSHRLSETLSLKSFHRTPTFRHANLLTCISPDNKSSQSQFSACKE